jgi:hypothetical protein
MTILSIDLASRRYSDFGVAQLEPASARPIFPAPEDLGLAGMPEPAACARAVARYAAQEDVSVILLDGPQAWKYPHSPIAHMRLCERVFNTPGRTGVPGHVKPRTYLGFISFSVALFTHLRQEHGWVLLEKGWELRSGQRWVVEAFPSAAWQTLGLKKLPAKARTKTSELGQFRACLAQATGFQLPHDLTHDQLQAAVVLPAGEAIARCDPSGLVMAGYDPLPGPGGVVYEGWIVAPRLAGNP